MMLSKMCVLERIIRTGGGVVNGHFSVCHRHGDEVVSSLNCAAAQRQTITNSDSL